VFCKYKEDILSLNVKIHVRASERRRKRFILPIIYFLAETVLIWLVLALIQVNFNMFEWSFWAIGVFIIGIVYSIVKTVNVYQRQQDYLTEENTKIRDKNGK
jgi:hypothetical protein